MLDNDNTKTTTNSDTITLPKFNGQNTSFETWKGSFETYLTCQDRRDRLTLINQWPASLKGEDVDLATTFNTRPRIQYLTTDINTVDELPPPGLTSNGNLPSQPLLKLQAKKWELNEFGLTYAKHIMRSKTMTKTKKMMNTRSIYCSN